MQTCKKILVICFLLFGMLMLNACEPMMFGIPQSQWNQLNQTQQQQVIQGYYAKQEIDAQNKPIVDAISATESVLQTKIK